jgi:hypothetical protein
MRVFIQNIYPEAIMIPGEETTRWVPASVGDGGEYDQFYNALQIKTWDPPIPTVADPLCYTLKLREKVGAGLVVYFIGSYYGDESVIDTANEYVQWKYDVWPSLPYGATLVLTCTDDQHPATHFSEVMSAASEKYTLEGYWLASDPTTFVSVP